MQSLHCILAEHTGISWFTFIAQILSVLVGGMITLALVYLKEWRESNKAVAEWFYTEYIEKCIDALAESFGAIGFCLSKPAMGVEDLAKCNLPVFQPAMPRLKALTSCYDFGNWFSHMHAIRLRSLHTYDIALKVEFQLQLDNMVLRLLDLRQGLLGFQLKSKRDIIAVQKLPCVIEFNKAVKEMAEDLERKSSSFSTKYEAKPRQPE